MLLLAQRDALLAERDAAIAESVADVKRDRRFKETLELVKGNVGDLGREEVAADSVDADLIWLSKSNQLAATIPVLMNLEREKWNSLDVGGELMHLSNQNGVHIPVYSAKRARWISNEIRARYCRLTCMVDFVFGTKKDLLNRNYVGAYDSLDNQEKRLTVINNLFTLLLDHDAFAGGYGTDEVLLLREVFKAYVKGESNANDNSKGIGSCCMVRAAMGVNNADALGDVDGLSDAVVEAENEVIKTTLKAVMLRAIVGKVLGEDVLMNLEAIKEGATIAYNAGVQAAMNQGVSHENLEAAGVATRRAFCGKILRALGSDCLGEDSLWEIIGFDDPTFASFPDYIPTVAASAQKFPLWDSIFSQQTLGEWLPVPKDQVRGIKEVSILMFDQKAPEN